MVRVRVESSARLHLGFYNLWGIRAYGSIGVMIDKPRVVVEAEPAGRLEIINKTSIPVEDDVRFVLEKLGVRDTRITVKEAIPRHVGLGSTTQLMLSTAMAVIRLKEMDLSIREAAAKLGRGRVSGIGVGVFEKGGFIVDSGRRITGNELKPISNPEDMPSIMFHSSFPEEWVFTVIVPEAPRGLGEIEEWRFLSRRLTDTHEINCELYGALLEKMIPGILEGNPYDYAEALNRIQEAVGRYFSTVQGGKFSNNSSSEIAWLLLKHGALAVGQSSWGPTIYGFFGDTGTARLALSRLLQGAGEKGIRILEAFMASPRNYGAEIIVEDLKTDTFPPLWKNI